MSIDRVIQFVPSLGERQCIGWCASFVRANFVTLFLLLIPNMPALAGQNAGLTRPVVVGDSLAAGFQNHSLLDIRQVNGYAASISPKRALIGSRRRPDRA
jgi:hypothetical protein